MAIASNNPSEVPEKAVLAGEAHPLGWVERVVWTDRMLECLRQGGPEGGKWYWLHDKVFSPRTLRAAYERVAQKRGGCGVDGRTVHAFGAHLEEEIERIAAAWKAGTYRPQAIRRVWIPKPGSNEKRPLGIPTVRDRVVQAVMVIVLEPIFEVTFSPHSHGFRPGRSAKDALAAVSRHLGAGRLWVVDADLKGFFDSIPHARLLEKVRERVTDRRLLELIGMFLKAGVAEGGAITQPQAGTPQGGAISPLLANIYLNGLDHTMADSGVAMERYADDFVILCRSQEEAESALDEVKRWTAEAGLTLHPAKTRIVDMGQPGSHFDFLGFRFKRQVDRRGKSQVLRLVRPKSATKLKDAIRGLTRRANGHSLEVIIENVNSVLRGWFAYFRSVQSNIHEAIDAFVRRRLRWILAKRQRRGSKPWRGAGGGFNNLWTNAYFAGAGLFSLKLAYLGYIQLHRGTTD
jgi:RNA-directed DNA polymerase